MKINNDDKKIMFEATLYDVRFHNSKLGDDSWCDIVVRVLGEANIISAMKLPKAKEKIVKITYKLDD